MAGTVGIGIGIVFATPGLLITFALELWEQHGKIFVLGSIIDNCENENGTKAFH